MDIPYVLAVDTETDGFDWFDGKRPFIATASDYDNDYLFKSDPEDVGRLRDLVLGADVLVFHNASFDIHHMVAAGWFELDELLDKTIRDTDILARLTIPLAQTPNYKLKTLATLFVDEGAKDAENELLARMVELGFIQKPTQEKKPDGCYYQTWLVYPEIVETYAKYDTRATYDLYHVLLGKMEKAHETVANIEWGVLPTLIRMEHRGISLDTDVAAAHLAHYQPLEQEQRSNLYRYNDGEEWDPGKDKDLIPVLEKNGIHITTFTEKGQLRTDKNTLIQFGGEHPLIPELIAWRETSKLLSTYIEPLQDRSTIHTSFIQCGAWTGRMACMRPNMQNIPVRSGPEMRSMFVPRDGYALVVADYSSIELRLLALYMADPFLWDIIENGDPFVWLGEQLFGTSDQSQWPVTRQALKNGFYALTYGAGGPKLASTIGGGMTDAEGREFAKAIKAALNGGKRKGPYWSLTNDIDKVIKERGFVYTLGKRKQYVPRDKSYVGLNALIQGSAADIMKVGLRQAEEALSMFKGTPLLTVHDEVVAEVPLGWEEQALAGLRHALVTTPLAFGENAKALRLASSGVVCYNNYGEAK